MNPIALVLYKSSINPIGQVEFNPGLSLHKLRQLLFAIWDICCHKFFFQYMNFHSSKMLPLNVQCGLAHSMYHQQKIFQRKMDRSWREESICSNYSRIKLIASKLIGPEKGDNRLATEHCSEGCKFHKKVGVQCKIIYNSEAPYSTGLQNWNSWTKKSANIMQGNFGSSERLIIK